jgi:1,2-dihydroxy-3-keto-5-methylthiopentene dioxygenase
MTRLRIFNADNGANVLLETRNPLAITAKLGDIGVGFQRWHAGAEIAPGASTESVLAAYRTDINALMHAGNYQSVDVVSLHPEHPDRAALRQKFLSEHTHAEDEIRFFVAGSGLFTIHTEPTDGADQVFEVLCEKNDLINLPAGTKHWFDMGESPFFVAIRIFSNPSGWVANFTGSDLALRFPRFQNASRLPEKLSNH